MKKLALTAALADYDHVRDLALGRVQADGIELTCLTLPIEEIFFRFIVYREWEVSEISLAKYVALTAQGDESYWALPVFPSRVFRHSSIYVRSDGPVTSVQDLVGRRVGIPEWAQTAAVYSRGFLQHQYGIDLASIQWVQAGVNQPGRIEKVDVDLPHGVNVARISDKSLNQMLLSGEIDAAMAARPPDAFMNNDRRVRRLFANYRQVEQDYYRSTGIFPIMHAVAVRRDVLHHHPWVPRNLFKAFDEAKRRSVARA
jgi:4,5-dihydroxyphthalate decarboxylase